MLEPLVSGLRRPVQVTHAGDGTGRLFIVEQAGRILVVENGELLATPFLDIRDRVNSSANERGLLSVAFHPDYRNNGLFFVNYTGQPGGDTVIERFQVSSDNPNSADPNSGKVVLTIDQPEANHNGGLVLFGPDGYLYIGMGDGGGAGDRHGEIGNGQDLSTLLGKILRIDVNQEPYRVPRENPFVNSSGARPEIWSYGWRNPWRFSFDRETGDLYVGDVGQGALEEVDYEPAGRGGGNYGWRIMEGSSCYNPRTNCDRTGLILPIAEYSHEFGCSITGGYVYRGKTLTSLVGDYLYGDYCSGIVWSTRRTADGQWDTRQRAQFHANISSFGEDEEGELYLVDHSGSVFRLGVAP